MPSNYYKLLCARTIQRSASRAILLNQGAARLDDTIAAQTCGPAFSGNITTCLKGINHPEKLSTTDSECKSVHTQAECSAGDSLCCFVKGFL